MQMRNNVNSRSTYTEGTQVSIVPFFPLFYRFNNFQNETLGKIFQGPHLFALRQTFKNLY